MNNCFPKHDPVFYSDKGDNVISTDLLKQARKSGKLNLSDKRLTKCRS